MIKAWLFLAALLTAGGTQAQISASTATPPACTTVLPQDTLNGAVGTAAACMPHSDSSVPTNVQAANTTTDASGNWSVTWSRAFVSSSPIIHASVVSSGSSPAVCMTSTRSTTGASGQCWVSGSVTVSILGAVVNVFSSANAVPVMVVGREPTQ